MVATSAIPQQSPKIWISLSPQTLNLQPRTSNASIHYHIIMKRKKGKGPHFKHLLTEANKTRNIIGSFSNVIKANSFSGQHLRFWWL